jgi:heme A synthase
VHDRYVAGWPFVEGRIVPGFADRVVTLHFFHRVLVVAVLVLLVYLVILAPRRQRPLPDSVLLVSALTLYLVNVGVGAAHVFTRVTSTSLVVIHLMLANLVWGLLVAVTVTGHAGHRNDRTARPTVLGDSTPTAGTDPERSPRTSTGAAADPR